MFFGDWDGLNLCETCQDQYTTGRLCNTCAQQEMIDNDDMFDMFPEEREYWLNEELFEAENDGLPEDLDHGGEHD